MSLSDQHTILMTADPIGGVWTYALELTQALQKYEKRIHLATMGRELSDDQRQAAERIQNMVIHESTFALEWMENPWTEVDAAGEWLVDLEQEIKPDLIHLNGYAHGNLPWTVPVLVVGHSCVLSWWQSVHGEQPPSRRKTYTRRVQAGLQNADGVIGVTQFMLNQLDKYYGPFHSLGVIYNGRQKSAFYPSAKEPLIFSMGRLWDEAKNVSVLTEISSELDWPVYIAGEDRGQFSSGDNLHFCGYLSDAEVAHMLGKAAIYVLPARYEPFGLSVLEAALSGCVLVLGDIPSLREIWGEAALYVAPDDTTSLKQQIQKLIADPSKREEMSRKAMRRAQRYSPDQLGKNYAGAYQKLLQQKHLKQEINF